MIIVTTSFLAYIYYIHVQTSRARPSAGRLYPYPVGQDTLSSPVHVIDNHRYVYNRVSELNDQSHILNSSQTQVLIFDSKSLVNSFAFNIKSASYLHRNKKQHPDSPPCFKQYLRFRTTRSSPQSYGLYISNPAQQTTSPPTKSSPKA